MVDTEQMKDSGIEVVDVNGIFGDVVAIVIGFTVDSAFADSGTGQQSGKAPWVVIASVIVWGECTLDGDHVRSCQGSVRLGSIPCVRILRPIR